jgi:hypothetical protein
VSGVEGVAVTVGGRLLASLAAPAVRALGRKVLFRRTVARRVRRAVGFSCPWRAYRSWLTTLTQEKLSRPVEDVAGPLAVRLDAALTDASAEWQSRRDHLSLALRLVEATYPAIAAALGDAHARQLSETWEQQRSGLVRERLNQLAGPGAALSAADLAAALLRRSAARRAVRLQAFDLEEGTLGAYFGRIVVPAVPVGQVRLLVGDFGAGKSEVAEAWHRSTIEALHSGTGTPPFPVWLRALDLGGQMLEDAIDRQVGPMWRQGRGARIVVDGLDETDVATAQGLLESARILSRSYDNVQALLTARPGVVVAAEGERVVCAVLAEEDALALVELAGGQRSTWRWTADMRATVRRPLFALAAGAMLRNEQAPQGEADLIRSLVENALSKGAERSTVTSSETFSVLKHLAVALTSSRQEDRLSFSGRQVARSSRLVTDDAHDTVAFSLPIFQHWFAAQAILDGTVRTHDVVADAASFNRWRWAAAVAALSAPGPTVLDDLISTWVAANPGAAAWILNEAFGTHRSWRGADGQPLDAGTSGARLLRSVRTWADALGPLTPRVLPGAVGEGPIGLGVSVSGHWISVGLAAARPDADYVAELPPRVHPLSPATHEEWRPWFSGAPPEGDAWPWTLIRDRIAAKTLKVLETDPYLGDLDGVWHQERRFDVARHVAGRRSRYRSELLADEVRSRAAQQLGWIEGSPDGIVQFGRHRVAGFELQDLIEWIDATGATEIKSPLPAPDVTHPRSGWVWEFYSPERLMEFEVEVYGRACEAYDEALAHTFSRLGWSMPSSALHPFGVILELEHHPDGLSDRAPGLTVVRVPMPLISQLAPTGPGVIWATNGRAIISRVPSGSSDNSEHHFATLQAIATWQAGWNQEPWSAIGRSRTGARHMSEARPSASVAARWIWNDLESLSLGTGTFPQLR